MEEINIILHQKVTDYLEELVEILFQQDYFGFEENAQDYVYKIYDFIEFELANFPSKKTPTNIQEIGSQYVFYKVNQTTTWYIFFEKEGNRILVTYISNNHNEIVRFL